MARSLTAANAIIMISIADLFPVPQQLKQFATDDIFTTTPLKSAETQMGVDGHLSAGFVFVEVPQSVNLQADSPSCDIFDNWWGASQTVKDAYPANGVVIITSVQKKWNLTRGFLTSFPPMPDGGKILKPRRFEITWESIQPAAI